MTTTTARRPAADAVLSAAVDVARAAAEETAGTAHVGDHLGVDMEAERLAAHRFACLDPAYLGWHWSVSLARVSRSKIATVCEVVLLPGGEAVQSPEWLPWSERLAPGDMGAGDLLPTAEDDDRLEPGYASVSTSDTSDTADAVDDDTDRVALYELGLGRVRVLSPIGRDDAVDRWYSGERGPDTPIAEAAPAQCSTCGFAVTLGGSLRRMFGVCANAYSPSDGQVVSWDHGCGAHSEAVVIPASVEVAGHVIDEVAYDSFTLHAGPHPKGSVDDVADAEDLGHS